MLRYVPVLALSVFLFACTDNSDSGDPVLSSGPYKKMSDSIAHDPSDAGLYFRRGSALYENGEVALAENDLRKAWQLNPDEMYALRLANILKEKNPDTAIAFLHQAKQKLPQSIGLQIMTAKGYESKNQLDSALNICNEIIAQYPGQLDALMLKSEMLRQQNKNAEALSVLEQAYNFAPGDVELVHQLAFEYADAKNPKALKLSDSLIKVDVEQRHAEPYYFKGLYYENTKNYPEAIRYFDEAIRHNYNFLDAYMDKGQTFFVQKNYAEALKTFKLTTTVFPAEGLPYYWLGKTQEAMGDKKSASLNYQRAYGLDKSLDEAKAGFKRLKG